MMTVGRLCMKIAGRDAGKKCAIVDIIDKTIVLVDGETRRRKCNIAHLEPLRDVVKIKKGCSHDEIVSVFKKLGIELHASKQKKAAARPTKKRQSASENKQVLPKTAATSIKTKE